MTERFSDPAFEEVIEDSLLSFGCSPEIEDPSFRGLLIAAPEVVSYTPGDSDPITGAFAPVLVCGTYRLAYETLGLDGDFVESIVLIAVDEGRRETFTGLMGGVENEIEIEFEEDFEIGDAEPAGNGAPTGNGEPFVSGGVIDGINGADGIDGVDGSEDPELLPEDFTGDVITGHFNPNLAVVLELPERPADYIVYAVLGPYESNRVKVSVRDASGGGGP